MKQRQLTQAAFATAFASFMLPACGGSATPAPQAPLAKEVPAQNSPGTATHASCGSTAGKEADSKCGASKTAESKCGASKAAESKCGNAHAEATAAATTDTAPTSTTAASTPSATPTPATPPAASAANEKPKTVPATTKPKKKMAGGQSGCGAGSCG